MDDFYHQDFEILNDTTYLKNVFDYTKPKSDATVYVIVLSVFVIRSGLFLAQISAIPSGNLQILTLQNFIDISVNTIVYSVLGQIFAFGKDLKTVIGIGTYLKEDSDLNEFITGWIIIVLVSGLLTAAIGDRISFCAGLTLNFLISGVMMPLIIHWILTEKGWMRVNTFSGAKVSYKDYGYSCMVHMSGGFVSLLGLVVLDRRLMRFRDIDVSAIPDNGPNLAIFGYLLVILGFIGINIPTERYRIAHLNHDFYGIVLTNLMLTIFGSALASLFLAFTIPCEPMHKWTGLRFVQSGISGIAVISGGADLYHPLISIAVGFINGLVFFLISFLIFVSSLEDYCNVIPVHFISGLIGTLLPPVLGIREGFKRSFHYDSIHFTWQVLGSLAVLGISTLVFVPVLMVLDCMGLLRNVDEDVNHRRAKSVTKSTVNRRRAKRLFYWKPGDATSAFLEPGSKGKKHNYPANIQVERVDILYQKPYYESNQSNQYIPTEQTQEPEDYYKNQQYHVNYILNANPLTFFESADEPEKWRFLKGCGEITKNLKTFSLKKLSGIRNISDSKLLQRFKRITLPKRRIPRIWLRNIRSSIASLNNWPNDFRSNLETRV